MLRFIIKRLWKDSHSGLETEGLETLDAECIELEHVLLGGGYGESGYDHRSLVGVEILPDIAKPLSERDE
jgi:hypothetical protein